MTISSIQRQLVAQRADYRCEYCLLSETSSVKKHEPDHIIPRKHGGQDITDNLAWACFHCNRYKGSEVGAFDTVTGELTRLFNPRQDEWYRHFSFMAGEIKALTPIGRVTILVLQFNRAGRIQVREKLWRAGLFP